MKRETKIFTTESERKTIADFRQIIDDFCSLQFSCEGCILTDDKDKCTNGVILNAIKEILSETHVEKE